jgi:hypothetical protein
MSGFIHCCVHPLLWVPRQWKEVDLVDYHAGAIMWVGEGCQMSKPISNQHEIKNKIQVVISPMKNYMVDNNVATILFYFILFYCIALHCIALQHCQVLINSASKNTNKSK